MKTFLTALFILMVGVTFAQSPKYTYIDSNNNTYEYFSGSIKYAPASGTAKTVTLSKQETADIEALFKTTIETTTDHVATKEAGVGVLKYKIIKKDAKVFLKANSTSKTKLESALSAKVQ
jgi:hypothetical protein